MTKVHALQVALWQASAPGRNGGGYRAVQTASRTGGSESSTASDRAADQLNASDHHKAADPDPQTQGAVYPDPEVVKVPSTHFGTLAP